ncbi:MAG: TrkH family potassium uptake protein [Clostridiales bacterium]|nr:TrkH family potassium uptake protein [Clostridiales bacterium]
MQIELNSKRRLKPVQILAIGFALVILSGAVLLSLPISSNGGRLTPFVDCLFVATSAVCVTGLVTVDTYTNWNYFGRTVIMILIQIGGLGFMSFATLIALFLKKRITLHERLVMQEAMNTFTLQGVVRLIKSVLIFTFVVESCGAILLSTQFVPVYGFLKGIYYGLFHSVSAFCNAGFDIIGNFRSLTPYAENSVIIITIASLIVIGGLGFSVWKELFHYRKERKLSLHSKLAITMTAILIFGGAFLMFIFEMSNTKTIANMPVGGKVLSSFFAAVTPRTAGFNSISTSGMTPAGRFLTIILMFIGGSPGSTAGGIKTTTFGVLIMTIIAAIKGREDTVVFKNKVGDDTIKKAAVVATLGIVLVLTVSMVLSITEVGASLEDILYEVTSAFGTVGLTLGLTPKLTVIGKLLISFTMFCGRVGVITLGLAIAQKANNMIHYPEGKILIG